MIDYVQSLAVSDCLPLLIGAWSQFYLFVSLNQCAFSRSNNRCHCSGRFWKTRISKYGAEVFGKIKIIAFGLLMKKKSRNGKSVMGLSDDYWCVSAVYGDLYMEVCLGHIAPHSFLEQTTNNLNSLIIVLGITRPFLFLNGPRFELRSIGCDVIVPTNCN